MMRKEKSKIVDLDKIQRIEDFWNKVVILMDTI